MLSVIVQVGHAFGRDFFFGFFFGFLRLPNRFSPGSLSRASRPGRVHYVVGEKSVIPACVLVVDIGPTIALGHVAVPVVARLRLRAGQDHRHRRLWQGEAGHARADRRQGGRQDHGQDPAGQRPAARQAGDQRAQVAVAPQRVQAVPGDRHGDPLLRGHGVLRGRRAVRSHRREESPGRNGVEDVLQADRVGRVVRARPRVRAPRPQARERAAGQGPEPENNRLRAVRQAPGRHGQSAPHVVRFAHVRGARTHPRRKVPRVRGGRLEHGRHTVRPAVRLPAVRKRQHRRAVQENLARQVRRTGVAVDGQQTPVEAHALCRSAQADTCRRVGRRSVDQARVRLSAVGQVSRHGSLQGRGMS